jgi:tetratricopeptide (TPR) repeat protein
MSLGFGETEYELSASFTVDGEPQGKARPRVTRHGTYTPVKTKEYEKAVQWYMKAAEKGCASAYNGLAWALHLINKHEEALPWAEKAYKEFPQDTNVIDTLATVYQGLGRTEEALEMFELCLKIKEDQQMDDESLNKTKDKIEKLKEIQQKGQV